MRLPFWILGLLALMGLSLSTPAHASKITLPDTEAWVIEAADYTGRVEDRLVRLEAIYTIRVNRAGPLTIPLPLQGVVITDAKIERAGGEAALMPHGAAYALRVSKRGQYRVRLTCSQLLVQQAPFEGLQFAVPQATFSTLTLVVPHQDIELRPEDQLYMSVAAAHQDRGVRLTAKLGAATQVNVQWRTKPVTPTPVEPMVYGEVQTLVTYEEQVAKLWALAEYRITQGDVKQFRIVLPPGINVQNVRGEAIEEWRLVEDGTQKLLQVTLQATRKEGIYRLFLEGEQPLVGEATTAAMPALRLMGVKQERGYIAVARSGSLEIAPGAMEALQRIDVRELPTTLTVASIEPVLLAFKYHQHPYTGAVTLTRHADHPVLAAIAERGEMITILSQQGELVTRASYWVKGNKKQFLEVRLPQGATLWSCLVANRAVKPVAGKAGVLLVPLEGNTDPAQGIGVELVYFERKDAFTGMGQFQLQGPLLDVPTTVSNWVLYAPKEVKFMRFSGNVSKGAAAWAYLEPLPASEPMRYAGIGGGDLGEVNGSLYDDESRQVERQGNRRATAKSSVSASGKEDSLEAFDYPYREYDKDGNKLNKNEEKQMGDIVAGMNHRLQETGVLPLQIRLPKAGVAHNFSRLMTTGEALSLQATFVHAPWLGWMPFVGLGMVMMPLAGLAVARRRN